MNNITLDEIIETGMVLLRDTDDYDILTNLLDVYIRHNYEDNGAAFSDKDMNHILYSAYRAILIDTYDITTNDKEVILDAILLYHDSIIGEA